MDIGMIICENWIIVLIVCIILFIIVVYLAFGKLDEEKKSEERMRDLTYEIERLKKENAEVKKREDVSLKDEVRNVMVTGKSIKGEDKF